MASAAYSIIPTAILLACGICLVASLPMASLYTTIPAVASGASATATLSATGLRSAVRGSQAPPPLARPIASSRHVPALESPGTTTVIATAAMLASLAVALLHRPTRTVYLLAESGESKESMSEKVIGKVDRVVEKTEKVVDKVIDYIWGSKPAEPTPEAKKEEKKEETKAQQPAIPTGRVLIENAETKRYLFADGDPISGDRGREGGWKQSSGFESPLVVGADANYYNRAIWTISPAGNDNYIIENVETKRYLFSDGAPISGDRGREGGWKQSSGFESPNIVGADANYYNRALWKIRPAGNGAYIIENTETKRYVFSDGEVISGDRGREGGWKKNSGFESPKVVGADANYYNRALWKIEKLGN